MEGSKLLYIIVVLAFNVVLWFGFSILKKKNRSSVKKQIVRSVSLIVQFVVMLISTGLLLRVFQIKVEKLLAVELFSLGESVSVTGFLILFLVFAVAFLIYTNRFLTRVLSNSKGTQRIPRRVISGLRRWVTLVVLLIIISGVIQFSDHAFPFFSITLFSLQDVQITIGKIIQALFIGFTVHVCIISFEYFYNERINKKGIDKGKGHTIFQIVKYFVWVITVVLILSNIGLSVNVLLAGSAALFVGLGFGVQSLFNDFVSGLIILFEGTIRVQDIVELENGIIGKVQEIGLRTSKLLTRDNIVTIIPNNNFVGKNVINWSYNEHKTRFKVDVGVSYGSDVRLVEKILIKCASEHDKIYSTPQPFVYFNDFGESSLDFSLFFWIDDSFWVEKVRSDLRFAIHDKFKENDVEIPFPQRDLHIRSGYKD
ncbi:mechanosensitive ion channel [Labilibacter sediminis]|nr:mechanosensitive ion channel [Labilibacter sediminis]